MQCSIQIWCTLLQGLPQQMLAAEELKRRSWRFHTHLNAWFRRDCEPKACRCSHQAHFTLSLM